MEQNGQFVVERHRLLTDLVGLFALLETLVEIGLAFGMIEFSRRVVFLAHGCIRFSLQLIKHVEEVSKLMEIVTHPHCRFTSGLIARHQAKATVGGHAKAVKEVIVKRRKMRSPGLGGAIRSQLDVEDGRALCVNGDQNGRVDGKELIAEIKHDGLRCHGQGRGQSTAIALEQCTERAHGVWLVVQLL